MIEDRLRETFTRVATGGPDEAGAFDRFQRHRRADRTRRLAGATALVLVAALASAVAVPRLSSDSSQRRLVVTGAAGPERWLDGPLVAVVPLQGFEVKVPDGWEANATWKGIELRPDSLELRRHLAGPVQLVTGVLDAFFNPAPNAGKGDAYEHNAPGDQASLPSAVMRRPQGRQSRGSFPGDTRWFRTDLQTGPWRTTQWHISWPYRCRPGVSCPAPLALRTLKAVYQVDGAVAQVDGLAERLLRAARPIANAVQGQPHASRPDCVDGRSMVLRRADSNSGPDDLLVTVTHFRWWARTTADLVPCTVRGPLGVELLDGSGRRLEVQGNPLAVTRVGDLPEASSAASEAGVAELDLKWFNWCGERATRMRLIGSPGSSRAVPIRAPTCIDRSKPSRLMVERIRR
ncbi:MAG TPA: hypothetical protein VHM23_01725 [Actinomycetota bacterium]|jgi:hypothetical protein|nr:hypothetical protein [Actinomycetota bacterium]